MVKYGKIPPAAAANHIAENARIPLAADLLCKYRDSHAIERLNKNSYLTAIRYFSHLNLAV